MQQVAEVVRRSLASGEKAVVGRVIDLKGFSTLPVDELVAVDADGRFHGELLGRTGASAVAGAAAAIFGDPKLETVSVVIHGPEVKELGLACGGQAEVLLQPAELIPERAWSLLAGRAPVALVTVIDGPAAGPSAVAVDRDGRSWGTLAAGAAAVTDELVQAAHELLGDGRTASRRVDTEAGVALLEAWVPPPRLVVVGSGDMVDALGAQARLLGWELRATDDVAEVEELLGWAGETAALVVLSHDPHVDVPALAAGLARPLPYVGAMGSRSTQSRRLERLASMGVDATQLERIHRPIGLNLGGRRAPEVALSIVAEILAVHCGADAQPLRASTGPIHGRPAGS